MLQYQVSPVSLQGVEYSRGNKNEEESEDDGQEGEMDQPDVERRNPIRDSGMDLFEICIIGFFLKVKHVGKIDSKIIKKNFTILGHIQ